MTEKNHGRDDLMAVAAFRYSLGRMTYIVSLPESLVESVLNAVQEREAA